MIQNLMTEKLTLNFHIPSLQVGVAREHLDLTGCDPRLDLDLCHIHVLAVNPDKPDPDLQLRQDANAGGPNGQTTATVLKKN